MELAVRTALLKEADVAGVLEELARTGQVLQGLARSIRARRLKQAGGVALALLAFLAAAW